MASTSSFSDVQRSPERNIALEPHSAVTAGYTACDLVVNIKQNGAAYGSRNFACNSTSTLNVGVANGYYYTFD
jgi:hypothetical protein